MELVSYLVKTYKIPLGRPRHRWEDNIRMDRKEIGINTRNWVDSALDRDYWRVLVNTLLNLWVPQAMELVALDHSKGIHWLCKILL